MRSILFLLAGALLGWGCAKPTEQAPQKPEAPADVVEMLTPSGESAFDPAVTATSAAGKDLGPILVAMSNAQRDFDWVLSENSIREITDVKLLGSPEGRKEATRRQQRLLKGSDAFYASLEKSTKSAIVWAKKQSPSVADAEVKESLTVARAVASETIADLGELLKLLDRAKPTVSKDGKLQMKGMKTGMEWQRLVDEVNHHVVEWATKDQEYISSLVSMLRNAASIPPV